MGARTHAFVWNRVYVILVPLVTPNNPLGIPLRSWKQHACIGINSVCPDGDLFLIRTNKRCQNGHVGLHQHHLNEPMHGSFAVVLYFRVD